MILSQRRTSQVPLPHCQVLLFLRFASSGACVKLGCVSFDVRTHALLLMGDKL